MRSGGARWLAAALLLGAARGADPDEPERPLCAPEVGARCLQGTYSDNEFYYTVNGHPHRVEFREGSDYRIFCGENRLDDAALPRFPRRMKFPKVLLEGCAPPASWAAALRDLNVSLTMTTLKLLNLPAGANLVAAAFTGLPASLTELEMHSKSLLVPEPGFLSAFPKLNSLNLDGVRVDELPANLDKLTIKNTGIEELTSNGLTVVELAISEDLVTSIPGPLQRLEALSATAPLRALPTAPHLRAAYVGGWAERAPGPLRGCERLHNLTLLHVEAETLPSGFVAGCALEGLALHDLPHVRALPPEFLLNATDLLSFALTYCERITSIPQDLFDYSTQLEEINLSYNRLESLPAGVFASLGALRWLSLERNRLHAHDTRALGALPALRYLNLARNPLGDLCPGGSDSSFVVVRSSSYLKGLYRLEELFLSRTNQTRLCEDWVSLMQQLRRLDLQHNGVRELAWADLRLARRVAPADVDLRGNPLEAVRVSEADFSDEPPAITRERAQLVTDARLRCDCGAYWLARALRAGRAPAALEPRCARAASPVTGKIILENTPLISASLDALTCALPAEHCAAGCACERTEQPLGLRVACAGPELPLPQLQRAAHAARLPLLALRARGLRQLPERLPADLQLLDLRGGNLSHASPAAAEALFAGARRVRVSRNPLRCHCDNWPLLAALRAHRASVDEYENTTCADGRPLRAALRALRCDDGGYAWLSLALVGGLALAGALAAAALARPETRLRLKALLHARGLRVRWLARRLDPPDADRPFDAFVSHADDDARFVYERLAPRLEPARRLCLAERDWPAGAWIPAQIEESVRRARRTVCVVSPRSLRAQWARAELRAAHAHALRDSTPRLVLLLLDVSAAELRAEPELRAALDAHAHVRWGEPCFWEKLAYALPDPRPPPAPPAAA